MTGKMPKEIFKKPHSLKAWGFRLHEFKGSYGEQEEAWDKYTPEMLIYNKQDVVVDAKLYGKFINEPYISQSAVKVEHEIEFLMYKMHVNGFCFDERKAEILAATIENRIAELLPVLNAVAPPIPAGIFIPKRDNAKKGYKKGVPIQRYKPFNPNSRQMLAYVLNNVYHFEPDNRQCYNVEDEELDEEWTKEDLMERGYSMKAESIALMRNETTDENLLKFLTIMEEQLALHKLLSQISTGDKAWIKFYKDGKIHGYVNPNGAVTARATHSSPNITQVPKHGKLYGDECRELFSAGKWKQVGIDACGLELRCLAHYLYPYDNGSYAHHVIEGDIHTENQHAAGLPTRDNAKRFIYAYLYGAGDWKIGRIVDKDNGDKKLGAAIKRKFLKNTPALATLRSDIQDKLVILHHGRVKQWKQRFLYALDKRRLYVRSPHSALNLLLQSAGAIICKAWCVQTERRLHARGLKHGWDGDYCLMAWVHDEQQIACRTDEIADIVIAEAQQAMRDVQKKYNFRVQLDTEGVKGNNWKECH
jgi:hypothetical protein